MKALSIRQPWAWLILNAGKDIENREWPTRYRGPVLIHASKVMTADEYDGASIFAMDIEPSIIAVPEPSHLRRGGIVGMVEIVDCVTRHNSQWFCGTYGFVLRDPKPLTFVPYRGALGFFDVPANAIPTFPHHQEQ